MEARVRKHCRRDQSRDKEADKEAERAKGSLIFCARWRNFYTVSGGCPPGAVRVSPVFYFSDARCGYPDHGHPFPWLSEDLTVLLSWTRKSLAAHGLYFDGRARYYLLHRPENCLLLLRGGTGFREGFGHYHPILVQIY